MNLFVLLPVGIVALFAIIFVVAGYIKAPPDTALIISECLSPAQMHSQIQPLWYLNLDD